MNPINDEMPTKDSTDVNKILELNKSAELSNITNEILRNSKTTENVLAEEPQNVYHEKENKKNNETVDQTGITKIEENVNIQENSEKAGGESITNPDDESNNTPVNENGAESEVNEKDIDEKNVRNLNDSEEQTDALSEADDLRTNEENYATTENPNRETCVLSEFASGDETEEFEDIEDVEIPEDEVDEIIVPDEAEAEDLTDEKDNDKSIHEDMEDEEDGTSKDSEIEETEIEASLHEEKTEIEASLHEEETTKSSEVDEKDEDTEKKSLNNDAHDDTSSKNSEEGDIENLPFDLEGELDAIEEDIKNTESALEETKSNEPHIDEDTTSQATYDPLTCIDNKEQDEEDGFGKNEENENTVGCQLSEKNENEVPSEGEDDEVQFVETRNSPICIESDDEDCNSKDTTQKSIGCNDNKNDNSKRIITTATATVPRNIIVTRTSARKSTAKVQQNQVTKKNSPTTITQTQNKSKNVSYLQKATNYYKRSFKSTSTQHIVDCIELLDSSDEESAKSRNAPTQQQKILQKRTLLAAKGNYYKNNNKTTNVVNNLQPNKFPPHIRQQPKKPAPPPLPPPTPQSNFLNAVQLQPAAVSGQNPPAFSALLSNKSVIIPNAFYGNPPSIRVTPEMELERRYASWLENFINQFCKPQFVATHSCLVFLQRALKYKDFVRIKSLRSNMNSHAQNTINQLNNQLMTDLKTIFLKNSKKITNYGRRFCELTCSATPGKAVTLMAHGISGKVTLKTCNMDLPKLTNTAVSSVSLSPYPSANTSLTRKRQLDEDEDEYTPDKSKHKTKAKPPSENGDEDSSEVGDDRKRSLRTKRTKRLDNSFSYNEDDLLAEYEIDDEDDEKLVQVEIERKIEQKRLEAQQQRQQQVKSFESAFIQAFAKSIDGPTSSSKTTKNAPTKRIRLKNTTTATVTSIRQYTANNDAEDLLQATWIENLENNEAQIISDDDEPKEHRIYKQQQQQQQQEHSSPSTKLPTRYNSDPSPKFGGKISKINQEEIITGDNDYDESYYNPPDFDPVCWPKNIDPRMYVNGKHKDRCIICNLSCQRLVHHYVNEHRGCEVYNSRLSLTQIRILKQGKSTVSNVSLYKNGQFQYEAFCIFCQKTARFMLPYWYQHFTMHTGEYAYRCLGCGIRKPTRSLLTQHQSQGCPEVGGVAQDYAHDPKSSQVEAKICNLCNYVQLHRCNIVKHLHTQHNIKQILPKHIQTIVLIKITATLSATSTPFSSSSYPGTVPTRRLNSRPSSSRAPNSYNIDDDYNDCSYEEILPEETHPQTNAENNYYNYIPPYMQAAVNSGNFSFEDVDAGEDLSFMICGMLDVQTNPEAN